MPKIAEGGVMKKIVVGFFIFVLGFGAGVTFLQWQKVNPLVSQVLEQKIQIENVNACERARTHQPGAAFNYGKHQGRPIQLVLETSRVVLQIPYRRNDEYGWEIEGSNLDYLKDQVEAAVAEKKGVRLQNGMTLRFEGYPIWGPHISSGLGGGAQRLYFGESATFDCDSKVIVVYGAPEKPVGYYPYTLPVS